MVWNVSDVSDSKWICTTPTVPFPPNDPIQPTMDLDYTNSHGHHLGMFSSSSSSSSSTSPPTHFLLHDLAWFDYTPTWWQTPSAASSNVSGWLDQTHPLPTFGHGRGCISWSPAVALMVAPPQFPWHVFNFEGGTFKSVCIKHYTTMQDTCTCGYVVYLNIFTRHIVKSEKKHSYTQSVWKAEAECKI